MSKNLMILSLSFLFFSCTLEGEKKTYPMPSWNQTEIKQQIIDYVKMAKEQIPEEDRIAVFDMDGTIACETPLWFEMAVSVKGMMDQLKKNPKLINKVEYQYAKRLSENPADTTVLNHWVVNGVNYLDSINFKAFENTDYEVYVQYARNYLAKTKAPKYDRFYADMFYQPMLELLDYLRENKFTVYIVSGSMQGIIWSICPQTIQLNREHLIGSRQVLTPVYNKKGETSFVIQKGIFQPKNDGNGKSLNIYSHIGKIPVFAFGNTTGDFGMFHLVSTSSYPNMALLLNHDDAARE
ncbi:MAG: HAD family hydrolase, partial [Bacteroidales bacterium]